MIRTILDVAADASPRELEQVIARAERLDGLDIEALAERLKKEHGRPGAPLLRAILAGPDPAMTRSPAEDALLDLVRQADLPEPRCNAMVGHRELDLFWPDHAVAVEVDGFAHHSGRPSFEGDRARGFALGADGIEVYRVTWRQINDEPFVVVRRLTAVLARAELRREILAGRRNQGDGQSRPGDGQARPGADHHGERAAADRRASAGRRRKPLK